MFNFSNSLGAMSPTYWSRRMGRKQYKTEVFRSLANFEEQAVLTNGQKVDRPYRSDIVVENYTKGTALTAQDLTATSDQLTVDTVKAALLYVDDVDGIQNKYSSVNLWADEAGRRLGISTDGRFLYEAVSANDTIDDGDVGGTAGNGITVSTTNIVDIFGAINMKMDANNLPDEGRFFAISPQFYRVLWTFIQGKQTMLGDRTGATGMIGQYDGLELFKTNNLTGSARWTTGDGATPGNTETLTIQGITLTWVSSIGSTAGNVLAEVDLATSIDNLVALINAGGVGDGVKNVSVSTANQRAMQDWVAVDGTTYVEVRVKGASYLTVSGSQSADTWAAATQIQHMLAGLKGAIDCVVQLRPRVQMASTVSAGKAGTNILPMTLFGVYTFYQGKNEIFDVWARSDAY